MEKIDLHVHTNYSDGLINIFDIFELAKKEEIHDLAITDHDTIINLKGAKEIAKMYDIDLIEGIEISVGTPKNMHILGYGIVDFEKIENYLKNIKLQNAEICKDVIKLLQEKGYDISLEEVEANMKKRQKENEIASMVAISKAKEKNPEGKFDYKVQEHILEKRDIAKLLVKKGYAKDNKEVYDKIMGKDCECYIPIRKVDSKEAIDLIANAGGVPVLAHPTTINVQNNDELIRDIAQLKLQGLKGIEVINKDKYDRDETEFYSKIAGNMDLIKTVGTDFHRTTNSENILGLEANKNIIDNLKTEIIKSNKKYKERGDREI